jgi:hypothetical protein
MLLHCSCISVFGMMCGQSVHLQILTDDGKTHTIQNFYFIFSCLYCLMTTRDYNLLHLFHIVAGCMHCGLSSADSQPSLNL